MGGRCHEQGGVSIDIPIGRVTETLLPALAAAATAAAAAATGALTRFVDREGAAVELGAVQLVNGVLSIGGAAHFDEAEAAGLTGHAVGHELSGDDLAVTREGLAELGLGGVVRKVADVESISHENHPNLTRRKDTHE